MPKNLASSFGIALPFDQKDFSFEAVTIGKEGDFLIVSAKPELITLKEEFIFSDTGKSFVGLVESVSAKYGVKLRFSNGVTKLVSLKDVSQADKAGENYPLGKLVRVGLNTKTSRLSLKRTVVESSDASVINRDQAALLQAFDKLAGYAIGSSDCTLKIGQKVQGKVQLVKDYGLITEIIGSEMTGFIVNEQKHKADKVYKAGETLVESIVLDIDFEKKIVDLSERLATPTDKEESKKSKKENKGN